MTKEKAFDAIIIMVSESDLYSVENPDLQYLLGFIDALNNAVDRDSDE